MELSTMDPIRRPLTTRRTGPDRRAEAIGGSILRYGLVFFLVSGGLAKFTGGEARFIEPLIAHSPLFAWEYGAIGLQPASDLIGLIEICLGALLALHRWKPRLAAIGGMLVAAQFVITLSFLFTTPRLSSAMSGFLLKDAMFLGAAVWSTGESLRRGRSSARPASAAIVPNA